jgi:hypothetical protein
MSDASSAGSQPQHPAAQGERRAGVVRGLPTSAGFEPWVASAFLIKRRERLMLVPQRLLQWHAGHLRQERQVRVASHRSQRPVGFCIGGAFAFGSVAGASCGQGPVPHDAYAAERAAQHCLLLLIGIRPAPIRCPHMLMIAHFFVKAAQARRIRFRSLCLPASWRYRLPPKPEGHGMLRRSW